MPSTDEIKSESNSLSEFYKSNNHYQIPLHQREYDWELTQLQEFWSDLINHVDTPETEKYFFGTVILVKEISTEYVFTVVDGQQRLSTSIIFIIALRDFMDEKIQNIEEKISKLDSLEIRTQDDKRELNNLNEQKYEYRDDLKGLEKMIWIKDTNDLQSDEPRLSLNLYNYDFFKKEILTKETTSEKFTKLNELEDIKKKDEKIRNCYLFFHKKLQDIDSDTTMNSIIRIRKIWNSFVYDFMLTEITINNLDHAYKIFENINNKGKKLATNNLVKNKLYEIIASNEKSRPKQIEILRDADILWQEMVETLEETNSANANEDKFLKHFLSAFVQPTKRSKVYSTIKEKYKDKTRAFELIEQLSKVSSDYAAIVKPDLADWFKDEDLVDNLKSLNTLGDGAVYPIILLAKSYNFGANNMKSLIRFLTKFFFRCKTICDINYSYIEPLVGDVCSYMRKGKDSTDLNELMDMMTKQWLQYPENDIFKIKFQTKDYSNVLARYPLKEIHNHNMGKKERNTTKIKDNADIEHIMPQTLNSDWVNEIKVSVKAIKKEASIKAEQKKNPKYDLKDITKMVETQEFPVSQAEVDDYHDQNYKKLANLTLLNSFKNKEIRNFSFAKKCEKYKTDDLEMTKKLVDYAEWNAESILKRQTELTEFALQIWDIVNNRK
jgi:uncharacterized protein with ParB-like and HNH nuclease domain